MSGWATVFLGVLGDSPLDRDDAVALLRSALQSDFSAPQVPAMAYLTPRFVPGYVEDVDPETGEVYRDIIGYDIADGPFRGRSVTTAKPFLSVLKWNVLAREELTPALINETRGALRGEPTRELRGLGYDRILLDVKPYGVALTGDVGVPPTPPLPGEEAPALASIGDVNIPNWLIPLGLFGSLLLLGGQRK